MAVTFTMSTVASYALPSLGLNETESHPSTAIMPSDATIQQRLHQLSSPVDVQFDEGVLKSIRAYIVFAQRESQQLLGLTSLYFPVFEHYLKVNHLPEQLKYLPIIESRLRPGATSHAGAAGLWQFTKGTGRQFHLRIDETMDERRDPIRSTEAAVAYLDQLYGKYRDWTLVLAAYNCGPARLNQAIRHAGSRDYWKVREFLPTETQNYIPRFIAASYLMQYYHEHGLVPAYPNYNLQLTRTTKLYKAINFETISSLTGLSERIIKRLNPSYQQAFIPGSTKGHYLILPETAMIAFQNAIQPDVAYASVGTARRTHVVQSGDTIESLAKIYKCSTGEIVAWNGMNEAQLFFRQELVIYVNAYEEVWRG